MAYVPVPKDLTKVKTKIALNLTKRQLVCFGLAATVGIPVYLTAREVIGNSTAVLLMIGLMLPFFLLAMFERDGQPAERLLRNFVRAKLWPAIRPYRTENLYRYLSTKGEDATVATQGKTATKAYCRRGARGKGK
ncbi:MAG: PrgI family protein [Defluviitaleaceae bacterium]|nr:PrgI family protein [Defluviitaleaceae bacterium]